MHDQQQVKCCQKRVVVYYVAALAAVWGNVGLKSFRNMLVFPPFSPLPSWPHLHIRLKRKILMLKVAGNPSDSLF